MRRQHNTDTDKRIHSQLLTFNPGAKSTTRWPIQQNTMAAIVKERTVRCYDLVYESFFLCSPQKRCWYSFLALHCIIVVVVHADGSCKLQSRRMNTAYCASHCHPLAGHKCVCQSSTIRTLPLYFLHFTPAHKLSDVFLLPSGRRGQASNNVPKLRRKNNGSIALQCSLIWCGNVMLLYYLCMSLVLKRAFGKICFMHHCTKDKKKCLKCSRF